MANITIESFNQTLNALLNANPHAKSKGDDFKDWCVKNFGSSARISHIREQRQTTNRVSEQFRYFDPIVVFVCDEEVKRDVLIQYISERAYKQLENVAIIGVIEELDTTNSKVNHYTYEYLLVYKHTDFTEWASDFFENVDSVTARKAEDISNTLLDKPNQIIFYGAPGTGKSYEISKTTEKIDELTEAKREEPRVFRITFHPDSDYSTFVGCYKPSMLSKEPIYNQSELVKKLAELKSAYSCLKFGVKYWESLKKLTASQIKEVLSACGLTESMGIEVTKGIAVGEEYSLILGQKQIIYRFTPQAFTNAYIRAWKTKEPVILVIEEINRGNCAQIFGDLFQLLDRDENNESKYPIDPDADLGSYIADRLRGCDIPEVIRSGKKMILPHNLYIWATMNTSDQSLFPIDSAFKRRWEWRYIKILEGKDENGKAYGWKLKYDKDSHAVEQDWWEFLQQINQIIASMTSSADKQLGYFFCKPDDGITISSERFVNKVVFYLWNDVFKDYAMDEGKLFKFIPKDKDGNDMEEQDLTYPDFFNDEDGKKQDYVIAQFIQHIMEWRKDNQKV